MLTSVIRPRPLLATSIRLAAPLLVLLAVMPAFGQLAPTIGYMHPAGGQAGETIEVTLGGYDWTPDMQVFVHDPRIKLQITGELGPVIVPEPPYWFGKKARRSPFPLPREVTAKLTIPAGTPPGLVRWQVVNANGVSPAGLFVVGDHPQTLEQDGPEGPQPLASLPVTVCGQIKGIEDVDRYQFTVAKSGPITCLTTARAIGSELSVVLEIRDSRGTLVADTADTDGNDTALTFAAQAGERYTASVYDVDFRGNRSYVYRLQILPGPRLLAAIPAAGKRGESRAVQLVGYGIATGGAKLETVTQTIKFPADQGADSFQYRLDTKQGQSTPVKLLLRDAADLLEPAKTDIAARRVEAPCALTGVLEERYGEDRYRVAGVKGSALLIRATAAEFGSPLDLSIAIFDGEGNQVAQADDDGGTTDAALVFTPKVDGEYDIAVSDISSHSGTPAANYRLTVEPAQPNFDLTVPDLLATPIGGTSKILLRATRSPGSTEEIKLKFVGLPAGVSVPEESLLIAVKKPTANLIFTAAEDAAAGASLVTLEAEAMIGEQLVKRSFGPILMATTITPPFEIDAEGKDDVTKWPRGTTFPAPVLIERSEGFNEEIVLEMASKQGRHRMGIAGPELTVPPGVARILYPVYLPEWLETTRTSRMIVNGVAKVKDPQGNVRYSLARQKTRMGFLPVGALLKLAAEKTEYNAAAGETVNVPLAISRNRTLTEPARLELRAGSQGLAGFAVEPITLASDIDHVVLAINVDAAAPAGEHELTIRATLMQGGEYPVISETTVLVVVAGKSSAE